MDYIDITLPLSEKTAVFPGDPEVKLESLEMDGYRITAICMSSHSGTHIDAPLHYIEGGAGVSDIPLGSINGEAAVVDLSRVSGEIGISDISGKTGNCRIIILKTGYVHDSGEIGEYLPLSSGCAEYLTDLGVTCVVTDTPSVESPDGDGSVHRMLLENDIFIIEMADLSAVRAGRYLLNALPLKLEKCDGSPVRAILYDYQKEI